VAAAFFAAGFRLNADKTPRELRAFLRRKKIHLTCLCSRASNLDPSADHLCHLNFAWLVNELSLFSMTSAIKLSSKPASACSTIISSSLSGLLL